MKQRRNMFIIVALIGISIFYTGCKKEIPIVVWEEAVALPEKKLTTDDYYALEDKFEMSPVEEVEVLTYDEYMKPVYTKLHFTDHGFIKGKKTLLVPLTEQSGSVFNAFGIEVNIETTGKDAVLTRGSTTLTFTEGLITMFVNREDAVYLYDMPIFSRGTLYVPLEPILDQFGIDWEILGNRLIIGG